MSTKEIKANFNFSQAYLITIAGQKRNFAERDLEDFTKFNVTAATIASIDALIEEAENYPDDIELEQLQKEAGEKEEAAGKALKNAIRDIMLRAENTYGANSAKYRRFDTKGLANLTETQLNKCAGTVIRVATEVLADLAPKGLKIEEINALAVLKQQFKKAGEDHDDAIANRDIASEERTILHNKLYAMIVELCNTGQQVWANKSEAKYNDYIIYDEPATEVPPVVPAS